MITRRPDPRLAIGVAAAVLALGAAPAGAANVLQNPGAEDDASDQPVTAWTTDGTTPGFLAKAYGGSFPGTDVSAANGGGAKFFWAGNNPTAAMSQVYAPTPVEIALIDGGRMRATLAADIGGWNGQDDNARVTLAFRGDNVLAAGPTLGPVLARDRGNATTLVRRTGTRAVPAGTRRFEVEVRAERRGGASNDGYVDNVLLELVEVPPAVTPPPTPNTRGIPNPTVRTDGPAVLVAPGQTTLLGCRRGRRKTITVRVQSSARGDVFVSIFSGVSSVRLFGSRWVAFRRPGSRRVRIRVPCPAKTADVRTVGLKSALATVERGDRRGIATPQARSRGGAVVIAPRVRPVAGLRRRPIVEVRVRSRRTGRVVVTVTGRAPGLRFSGRRSVRFVQPGVRFLRIGVRLRGSAPRGTASVAVGPPRVLR